MRPSPSLCCLQACPAAHTALPSPPPHSPPPLVSQLRVLCNNACAVAWTSFVILRAQRGAALRKLPVYSLSTWQLTDKAS